MKGQTDMDQNADPVPSDAGVGCPFNPMDLALLSDPHSSYRSIRERDRVHWSPHSITPNSDGAWYVMGHAESTEALRSQALVFNIPGRTQTDRVPAQIRPVLAFVRDQLGGMDPPKHAQARRKVAKYFVAASAPDWRPRTEQVVADLIDSMLSGPESRVDFVADFSVPLTITVISDLLGVPADSRGDLHRMSSEMLLRGGESQRHDPRVQRRRRRPRVPTGRL
jgi:cytochrome P450